jgi:excisionase family DNA binding protein
MDKKIEALLQAHEAGADSGRPRMTRPFTTAAAVKARVRELGISADVAAILAIPERTVRDKWKEWGLPAYRIGKHLRWKERDVYAWIERQSA